MSAAAETRFIFKTRGPLDPVTDHAICVPRPELDQLLRAAQAPTVDAYLAILSSRQTGKTTLLYQLRARLRPRGYGIALIDLSVVQDQAEPELYRYVASQINSELEPSAAMPRRRLKDSLRLPSHPVEFRNFLLDIARRVQSPRLVILIDEVEAVSEKCADGFFGTIRNVFSSRRKEDEAAFEKYLFVISGAKELHRLSTGPNSPLNIAERIYLQDLPVEGVRLLAANFARAAIVAPPETAQWLYDQTRGHPYLTQKLCAQIEQWHPGVITQEIVQRATVQLLRSDDHLEKMIAQVDAEGPARQTLEQVTSGKAMPFSRLQPAIARLELVGAIRDAGQCAIRNPIYYAALRAHFNITPAAQAARGWKRWIRPAIVLLALLFILLNVPFLYNYARDFYWTSSSINEKLQSQVLDSNFTIHYDRILRANSPDTTNISVDWDGVPVNGPVYVTFQADKPDITIEETARRTLDQPFQQVRFNFKLNRSGLAVLRYNPFNPATDHRQITLTIESLADGSRREVYTADFVVDYYSAFIFSAVVSIASFIGALGAIFGNVGRVRQLLGLLGRIATQPT
ncbi:MAG: AAA-like domain-containing protein [Chloroflexi bacterium]|nr:AAA-like domain-containing protein [Chloroflexota bacterium]